MSSQCVTAVLGIIQPIGETKNNPGMATDHFKVEEVILRLLIFTRNLIFDVNIF